MARHRHDGRGDFVSRTDSTFTRRLTDDATCRPDLDPERHNGYTWSDVPRRPEPAHRAVGDLVRGTEALIAPGFGTVGVQAVYRWNPHTDT